jgi:hypothetical protein
MTLYPSFYDLDSKAQKPTGQKFLVKNSAEMGHNTAWKGNSIFNAGTNYKIAPKAEIDIPAKPCDTKKSGEDLIKINCDLHKWMSAYAWAFDHPYAAVTKEDGTYEIKNAPAGAEVELVYWHESMSAPRVLEPITLKDGEAASKDIKIIPDEKICVVVLANMTRHFPGAVTEHITNAILANILGGEPEDFPIFRPDTQAKVSGLPESLRGKWTGIVQTHEREMPLVLSCRASGEVDAQLADQSKKGVTDVRFESGVLTGKMAGTVGTRDANRRPHDLEWELTLRGEVMNGTLYAVGRQGARGLRLGYWVELHRGKTAD